MGQFADKFKPTTHFKMLGDDIIYTHGGVAKTIRGCFDERYFDVLAAGQGRVSSTCPAVLISAVDVPNLTTEGDTFQIGDVIYNISDPQRHGDMWLLLLTKD